MVLFLFTPQNYSRRTLPTAEFGKMRLRIEETLAAALLARSIGDHVDSTAKPPVSKCFMIFFAALR
jgi:hypothetical protein